MSLLHTAKAVGWALLGVRKRTGYEEDLDKLKPLHVIAAALLALVLFVGGLVVLVNWVVRN
ncbi:MAG TPA: DUF2970 domain-containing protein [Ramlibacter sp.]|nr:DUF2970 domain-containing protein [Ramlibacter sp.]